MLQIGQILFPVDFSTRCSATAGAVQALAQRTGAMVTLFHAVRAPLDWIDPPYPQSVKESFKPNGPDPFPGISERLRAERLEALRNFRPELWNPVRTRYVVEIGDPASALLTFIESATPDLVMIPTQGHRAFHRFLTGSVTTRLLHDAPCPVWTDAHVEEFRPGVRDQCEHVFCALDLVDMDRDRALVRWAINYARIWEAPHIQLVHAVPGAIRIPGQPDEPFALALMSWARDTMKRLQLSFGSEYPVTIEAAKPAELLMQVVQEPKSSVVVIGKGRPGLFGSLGSQAYSIIRSAPCPVIRI
jgi:nucleotide-binding universal stress UspA family protein